MNRRRSLKPLGFLLAGLLSMLLISSGCGPGQLLGPTVTPSPTFTATPTSTPAPTPTPTPPPVAVTDWKSVALSSVCLDIQETFTNIEGDFSVPMEDTAIRLLERLGVRALKPGAACDATLTIKITAEARSEKYASFGECYSGSRSTGQASLSAAGQTTFETEPYSSGGTPFFIDRCMKEPKQAPFSIDFSKIMVDAFFKIWGKPALLAAVNDPNMEVSMPAIHTLNSPQARTVGIQGSEVLALLTPMIKDDYQTQGCLIPGSSGAQALDELGNLAHEDKDLIPAILPIAKESLMPVTCKTLSALAVLRNIGTAALETTPALIELMSWLESQNMNENYISEAADALRAVTGQDFGTDVQAWQQWWDTQN